MKLLKMKKNKIDKTKPTFIVELTEDEYVQTKNFLENNKNGMVYIGDGTWKSPDTIIRCSDNNHKEKTIRSVEIEEKPVTMLYKHIENTNSETTEIKEDSDDEVILLNENNTTNEVQ